MVAPVLGSYEYQFMDGGVLLNGSSSILPFIDVTNVKGLDLPSIESKTSEYDGRHGGYVYAQYTSTRTIIIDANLYAATNNVDAALVPLIANFMPRENDAPFYFKGAGIQQQYIMCKPIGLNYDITTLRRFGVCNIQIQLEAGDPIKYIDKAPVTVNSGSTVTLTNNGLVTTYPVVSLVGAASEVSVFNANTGETVTMTYNTDADDVSVIDFTRRDCTINDQKASGFLTSFGWFGLEPGKSTRIGLMSASANLMVNGNCEANFGTGYSVGVNWTGTQQYTTLKHSGSKSLYISRKNITAANGYVVIPTGQTGLSAGTYYLEFWMYGTVPKFNISVLNGGAEIASMTGVTLPTTTAWYKKSITFTLTAASGAITINVNDAGNVATAYKKAQSLAFDDFVLTKMNTVGVQATISSKDGWL